MTRFDLSGGSRWGHMLTTIAPVNDGFCVCGCLTPLPIDGDEVLAENGSVWTFSKVEPWGNPRDGFSAIIRQISGQIGGEGHG